MKQLLDNFPKKRPPLPGPLQNLFDEHYLRNRESSSENLIHKKIESWCHNAIPDRLLQNKNTLEVGAGTLNHLSYEKLSNKSYDIIEPKDFLYRNSAIFKEIRSAFSNYGEVPKKFYDRIISIAVLEHMEDLPYFLSQSAYSLKNNGYHSHSIPCEGYPFWNWSWTITRSIPFRIKTGYPYKLIQKHEHLNNFKEITDITKIFYKKVNIRYSYPSFCTPYLSLFANITFSQPNFPRIEEYLTARSLIDKK